MQSGVIQFRPGLRLLLLGILRLPFGGRSHVNEFLEARDAIETRRGGLAFGSRLVAMNDKRRCHAALPLTTSAMSVPMAVGRTRKTSRPALVHRREHSSALAWPVP